MFRPLELSDYYVYYYLINQFRETDFSYNQFSNLLRMQHINIWVVLVDNKIVGCGTILYEQKLIHNYGIVAHIEDVVISNNHKNKNYGSLLIEFLMDKATEKGCYKIILNCEPTLKPFYEKLGFINNGLQMSKYLT